MSGMRPTKGRNKEPDWEKERARYPGHGRTQDDSPNAEPEEQPKAMDEGNQNVTDKPVSGNQKEQSNPRKTSGLRRQRGVNRDLDSDRNQGVE